MGKQRSTRKIHVNKGDKFGTLTVVQEITDSPGRKVECLCDCGKVRVVSVVYLVRNPRKNCRCSEVHHHGMSSTKLYRTWVNIIQRCENPNFTHYHRYGGRGITICKEWREDVSKFKSWCLDNGYAETLELDRINNDGNYEPTNCRWVTKSVNSKNKPTILKLTYRGQLLTLFDILSLEGIPFHKVDSFRRRLRDGQPVSEIVADIKSGKRKIRNNNFKRK